MKKFLSILVGASIVAQPLFAYDPYQDMERQRQATQRTPNETNRPNLDPVSKTAEFKKFASELKATQGLVFKDGVTLQAGALKQSDRDSNGNVQAEAKGRYNDFSAAVQQQIETKMPGAPTSNRPLEVSLTVGKTEARVDSVKPTDDRSSSNQARQQTPVQPRVEAAAVVPPVNPAAARPAPVAVQQSEKPAPAAAQSRVNAPAEARSDKPSSTDIGARTQTTVAKEPAQREQQSTSQHPAPVLVQTVIQTVFTKPDVGASSTRNAAAATPATNETPAQAVVPTVVASIGGAKFEVAAIGSLTGNAAVKTIEIKGPYAQLPSAVKDQISLNSNQQAQLNSGGKQILLTVAIRENQTFEILSANVVPAVSPVVVTAPTTAAPVSPAAPTTPTSAVQIAEVPAVKALFSAAQEAAPIMGVPSSAIAVEAAPVKVNASFTQAPTVVVPRPDGQQAVVRELRPIPGAQSPRYEVQSTFGDLSTQLKGQVLQALSEFGAQAVLKDSSFVNITFDWAAQTPTAPAQPTIVQISVVLAKEQGSETVLMWVKAPPAGIEAQRALPTNRSEPRADSRLAQNQLAQNPALTQQKPLGPLLALLAKKIYGIDASALRINSLDATTGAQLSAKGLKGLVIDWLSLDTQQGYQFAVTGKPIDFTDEVREAVYAKLKEALENGEIWARDLLKGDQDLSVAFEVDNKDQVKVKSVSQTPQEVAQTLAKDMGLSETEYVMVQVGKQTLVVLERNVTGLLKFGKLTMKLKSPDGETKLIAKRDRAKGDQSALLILSRKSLEANKDGIVRLTGPEAGPPIEQMLKKNPGADQFIVKLDPQGSEKLIIVPENINKPAAK